MTQREDELKSSSSASAVPGLLGSTIGENTEVMAATFATSTNDDGHRQETVEEKKESKTASSSVDASSSSTPSSGGDKAKRLVASQKLWLRMLDHKKKSLSLPPKKCISRSSSLCIFNRYSRIVLRLLENS